MASNTMEIDLEFETHRTVHPCVLGLCDCDLASQETAVSFKNFLELSPVSAADVHILSIIPVAVSVVASGEECSAQGW